MPPSAVLHSDTYTNREFGQAITEAIVRERCVCCTRKATEFSTDAASTEYLLTGLCELCQRARADRAVL